ncbi:MAG: hypothetical protein QXP32_05895 [Nitrososphaeria archaeon]
MKEISTYLGVKEEDLIILFVVDSALKFPKWLIKKEVTAIARNFKISRFDALDSIVYDTLNVGILFRLLFNDFFYNFNCRKLWPSIEDIIWVENYEGIKITFYLKKLEFISYINVTLLTTGSDHIQITSFIGDREELKDEYEKIKEAFTREVESIENEILFKGLQNEMGTGLKLYVLDEDDILSLELESCLRNRILPDFMKVERLFKKLYKKAFPKKLAD